MSSSIRREELRDTGLAVACLLLCAFLGVVNIRQFREKGRLEVLGVMDWLHDSNANMVGDPRNNIRGNLHPVPQELGDYAEIFEKGEGVDPDRTPLESLEHIRDMLKTRTLGLQRDLAQHGDITQPQSAFTAAVLVLGVLEDGGNWRPSLRRLRSTYQPGRRGKPDSVKVTIDMTFFASDSIQASLDYEGFEQALREQPWFISFEKKSTEELADDGGISVRSLPITVDLSDYR